MREQCVICIEPVEGLRLQYHGCRCQIMIHPYCKNQWDGVYPGDVCPLCRKKSPTAPTPVPEKKAPLPGNTSRKVIPTAAVHPPPPHPPPPPSAPPLFPISVLVTEEEYYNLQGSPATPSPTTSVTPVFPSAPTSAQVFRHPIRCNPMVAGVMALLMLLIIYLAYLWSHA